MRVDRNQTSDSRAARQDSARCDAGAGRRDPAAVRSLCSRPPSHQPSAVSPPAVFAAFLAHLIATKDHAADSRRRRRAGGAIAAYRAAATQALVPLARSRPCAAEPPISTPRSQSILMVCAPPQASAPAPHHGRAPSRPSMVACGVPFSTTLCSPSKKKSRRVVACCTSMP